MATGSRCRAGGYNRSCSILSTFISLSQMVRNKSLQQNNGLTDTHEANHPIFNSPDEYPSFLTYRETPTYTPTPTAESCAQSQLSAPNQTRNQQDSLSVFKWRQPFYLHLSSNFQLKQYPTEWVFYYFFSANIPLQANTLFSAI